MQAGSIQPGQNVVVIDDLIATGEQHVYILTGLLSHSFLQEVLLQLRANSSPNRAGRRSNTSS